MQTESHYKEIHEPKPSGYLVRAAKRIRDREHKRIVNHSYPDGLTKEQWLFLVQLGFCVRLTVDGRQARMAEALKDRLLVTIRRTKAVRRRGVDVAVVRITAKGFKLAKERRT